MPNNFIVARLWILSSWVLIFIVATVIIPWSDFELHPWTQFNYLEIGLSFWGLLSSIIKIRPEQFFSLGWIFLTTGKIPSWEIYPIPWIFEVLSPLAGAKMDYFHLSESSEVLYLLLFGCYFSIQNTAGDSKRNSLQISRVLSLSLSAVLPSLCSSPFSGPVFQEFRLLWPPWMLYCCFLRSGSVLASVWVPYLCSDAWEVSWEKL